MAHRAIFFNLGAWAEPSAKQFLAENVKLAAAGVAVGFSDRVLDKDHLPEDRNFDIVGIFADSKIDAAVIDALPNLKLIATLSTGFDHIDYAACAARGIAVSSVPNYGENTVAEFAFALILALSRKVCEAARRVKEEGNFTTAGLRGFDLEGKMLGVVGTGRIGKRAARIAKGFGMNVVAFDVYPDDVGAKEIGFVYKPLQELLMESDVVTLHVPYMSSTHHLINKDTIKFMKKGAYIVNTARGGVIETKSLIEALKSGALGGAGLDVLEEEGVIKNELNKLSENLTEGHDLEVALGNHALIDMPNVIITPHNAFNTQEAFGRILEIGVENILNFTKGAPTNLVK